MEQLGIDPSLLLAQIVNFAIIILVLTKLLYKPILKQLAERRQKIEEGLELTEKMRQEEEKLKEKEEKLLADARKQARHIIDDAQKEAKNIEKDATEQARREAETIMAKGKAEAKKYHESMEGTIRAEAVDLAVAMSKQLLSRVLSDKDQEKLLSAHIQEIKKMKVH